MPMIDVYSRAGTFKDKRKLILDLTAAMMRWERVPPITLFRENTAAFVHDLDQDSIGNAAGQNDYVRVQILTPLGVLDREKQLGVVSEMTAIVTAASGDPSQQQRIWVLISEASDGGWGIDGHAYTNQEVAEAARRELGK
jgi:phenylpyruvate tautomerase PptA (4-oxalocrotonate tautomerase family)